MELLKNLEGMSADEQMTAVVELQKAAMKQLEEQKQVSIGKSAEMVIQGLKKIKSDFEAKFDSLNYDIQAKVANLKDGEQGIQGPKGDQGDRGLDGANGRDGRDGKDGQDGLDGVDGVGVRDAKIDFDGSLVISLTDGREINCGEVVSVDVAKQIQKVTHNIQTGAGGDSQTVLDAITALQATIATYGTMATQNKTSVDIEGGTIDNTVIGGTTPAAGTFTTLTATGQTSLGGAAGSESLRVALVSSAVNYIQVNGAATGTSPSIQTLGSSNTQFLNLYGRGTAGGTNIGSGTTTQFAVRGVAGSATVNYLQANGSTTSTAPILSAQGSDTNISQVFQSKGTGAIDLAAGSSGVNISNGGTVTALTRTSAGSAYTTIPNVVITAPTTAGGVQATAVVGSMVNNGSAVVSGGTGYAVGNTLTVVGGTNTGIAATLTVTAVSGGVITTATPLNFGQYTVLPTNPVSVTGGAGTGATFNLTWGIGSNPSFTITNAGSGYVEQPTVSFSGGGGSGAAAYATVGGVVALKGLGTNFDVFTANANRAFRFYDSNSTGVNYWSASNGTTPVLYATGSSNTSAAIITNGTGSVSFQSAGGASTQMAVSHTASAVNYVQVTGAATGGYSIISGQGSDTNTGLIFQTKGTAYHRFSTGGSSTNEQLRVLHTASTANRFELTGAAAGASPVFSVAGSDTNIDLALTPKGTGNVRFGTYTANMALTVQGYIEIKDSGGTVRKLAVIA